MPTNLQPAAPTRDNVTREYIRACLEASALTIGLPGIDSEAFTPRVWCFRIRMLALAGIIAIPVIALDHFGEPVEVGYLPAPSQLEFMIGTQFKVPNVTDDTWRSWAVDHIVNETWRQVL